MITVTADASLPRRLSELDEPAEIRDAAGELLGYFTPAAQDEQALYNEARSHFDPQEIQRRKAAAQEGYTTQDVLQHVRSLERD